LAVLLDEVAWTELPAARVRALRATASRAESLRRCRSWAEVPDARPWRELDPSLLSS
jgi:hypothetical protein